MSWLISTVVICALFGYGFFLGWWARGKCLRGIEHSLDAWRKLGGAISKGEQLKVTSYNPKTGEENIDV